MVVTILVVAICLSGYVNNLICAHYSLQSARAFLQFNSESIINSIGEMMMNRNNDGIHRLIAAMSRDSTVYGDIRLVSHPSGEVVVSRYDEARGKLDQEDKECTVCHGQVNVGEGTQGIVDQVSERSDGIRVLSVSVPILNAPGCRAAACHAHAEDPPILGFLHTDYSLQRIDAMTIDRRGQILVTVIISILLGTIAMWLMFTRQLGRPISALIAGTEQITVGRFDFRFDASRKDEIGVLEDSFNTMTERVQAHRGELRATLDYLGGIVENSADIIITVTADGFIETFNRGAEEALGYSRAEVIGDRVEKLFADPRERDTAIAELKNTGGVKNYETRFLAKDGQVRSVLLTLSYLRDKDGTPIGTFGISKDITQEKELLRELVHSQKFAALGQAATGIQHAIKNMLNALKGGIYLVRIGTTRDNEQQVEDGWAMVSEGVERISNLSRNMLNYAKEWKPELKEIDLNHLVADMCELNRQYAAKQGVALHVELPDRLPPVLCDPKLIHMAGTDILVNAIEACTWRDYGPDESPEVVVRNSLTDDGKAFEIEIRDNGCGIDEEMKKHLFVPFFSTKKTQGTGLGLALTARIIKVHDGTLTVDTELDQGAVFRIRIPMDGPRDNRESVDDPAGSRN